MNLRIMKKIICLTLKACRSLILPFDLGFQASRRITSQKSRKAFLRINILSNSKAIRIV